MTCNISRNWQMKTKLNKMHQEKRKKLPSALGGGGVTLATGGPVGSGVGFMEGGGPVGGSPVGGGPEGGSPVGGGPVGGGPEVGCPEGGGP